MGAQHTYLNTFRSLATGSFLLLLLLGHFPASASDQMTEGSQVCQKLGHMSMQNDSSLYLHHSQLHRKSLEMHKRKKWESDGTSRSMVHNVVHTFTCSVLLVL